MIFPDEVNAITPPIMDTSNFKSEGRTKRHCSKSGLVFFAIGETEATQSHHRQSNRKRIPLADKTKPKWIQLLLPMDVTQQALSIAPHRKRQSLRAKMENAILTIISEWEALPSSSHSSEATRSRLRKLVLQVIFGESHPPVTSISLMLSSAWVALEILSC